MAVEEEVQATKQELGTVVAESFEQAIMRKERIYADILKREAASISPIKLAPRQQTLRKPYGPLAMAEILFSQKDAKPLAPSVAKRR